ncbi:MAG: ABC transporter permease, partial [Burkholderia sp.]|nr:ABC transporter permease [Burkholderia sp.]
MSTIEHASAARTASATAGGSAAASARIACTACEATLAAEARRARTWPTGIAAALAWAALGALTQLWPNRIVGFSDWAYTDTFGTAAWTIAALLLAAATLGHLVPATRTRLARVRPAGP